ncbi:hypothetical protein [Winogradskyella forsetii]|uniref:hypothetical protein n=1 Tax=Winogradskyella forsetii TaxID=2686077 RepID=UPI0015B94B23|nr:hypothetical protein [Winogradskyella forsetii]
MILLIMYSVLMISGVTLYLVSHRFLMISDFIEIYTVLKKGMNQIALDKQEVVTNNELDFTCINTGVILNKSLKNLEFISQLESYMESTDSALISSDFIKEIESNKFNSQLLALKSSQILCSAYKAAA